MDARIKDWQDVESLVRRAQVGDREAFGELFERFRASVLARARQRHRDAQEAEELVQEVFLHALRKIGQLREPACFGAWLHRITVRVAINRAVRRPPLATAEPEVLEAARTRHADTPLDDVLRAEQRRRVRLAVSRLRPIDRDVLVAYYLRGKPLARIARELDAPLGTIKRRLHIARRRLKDSLSGKARRRRRAPALAAALA